MHIAKKLISLLLAFVMLTGCLTHMSVRAQTDEVVESGALTVHGSTTKERVLVTVEAASRPTVNDVVTRVEGSGTITLNGVEQGYLFHENGIYFLIFDGLDIENGAVALIKGQFKATDGFVINIQETEFEYNSESTPAWSIKKDITKVSSGSISLGNMQACRIWFSTETKSESLTFCQMTAVEGSGSITVQGETNSGAYLCHEEYQGGYLIVMDGITFVAGDRVVIQGMFQTIDGSFVIDIEKTTFVCVDPTGTEGAYWKIASATDLAEYQEVAVSGIDSSATQYKNAEQGWHFYLDLTEKSSNITFDSALSGFEYSLNDGERKALTVFYAGHRDGSLFFIMPELSEVITDNTKLTIFSGQAITDDECYGLKLSSDVQLYGNRYGWSLEGYLVPDETGVRGDVNGDSETDIFDLIYLKKYLHGTVTISTQAEITKNDYVVDEDDADSLRQILVTSYNSEDIPLGIPTYQDDRKIEMAAYMGPRSAGKNYYVDGVSQGTHTVDFINDFEFKRYKDAGFTYLIAEQDAAYGSDNLSTYMELAKNNDLEVVLLDNEMTTLLRGDEVPTDTSVIATRTAEMREKYGDTFKGWMLADEPTIAHLNNYKVVANAIRQMDPINFLMTAFLPLHALTVDLTTDETILDKIANGETLTDAEKNLAYMEYVDSYGNVMGEFNYDLYPLLAGTTVRGDWLRNLSLVAQGGRDNRYLTGITLQAFDYKQSDDEGNATVIYRAPTEEDDIGYQVYTALAYGMRKLNYYTYWGHYRQSANGYMNQTMVQYPEGDGTQSVTTPIYEAVQSVNTEIKEYDHVLMNYAWEGTITLGSANDYSESEYTNERVASCSATDDTSVVIGCMKDAVGYDGYMIVNANNPANDMATTVTVQFEQATQAVVYIDGKQTIVNLDNGLYEVTVPSGEGVFVIPIV